MPDIVALGECMVEFFAQGPLGEAQVLHKSYGGDTLNAMVTASRLGASTGYITKVGNDPFCPFLIHSWEKERVDTSRVQVVPGFNGIYFIALLPGGGREFTYYRVGSAASTLSPQDLDEEYIASAKILHVSGISQAISPLARAAVLAACQIAKERGVWVSYDPNLRLRLWPSLVKAQEAMEELLPYVDIILPSAPEEAEQLIGVSEPQEVVEYFWKRGIDFLAVKAGVAGCWVGHRPTGLLAALPTPKVQVVDTTGAGDAFDGGVLYGLSTGLHPLTTAALGVITASLKVRGRGAIASLPTKEEVYATLAAHSRAWGIPV